MKTYIQIGANVGNDGFQRYVASIDERIRLILIEPNSDLLYEFKKNYNNLNDRHEIIILPQAISPIGGIVNLYLRTDIHNFGGSSLLNRKRFSLNVIREVTAITFNMLCENYSIGEVEYLCIDTEALDYEILNSIDLLKINIKTIFFEKWDSEDEDLNGKYKNGVTFFNEHIIPKFKEYNQETIIMDGMPTYKFTKK
jgi:FkbM family methyltransferase